MALKIYKPVTSSQRFRQLVDRGEITKHKPEKTLTTALRRSGGRNAQGRLTVRSRGGGAKRRFRIIDFKREKDGVPAKVEAIEYDPNRSANIALVIYSDSEKRYIIHPQGLKVGDDIQSGPDAPISIGNALPLAHIPDGTCIHNIELTPRMGACMARSAGNWAQIMGKEGVWAQVKMPSGEIRRIRSECRATIGQVGNAEYGSQSLGSAGASRHRGRRSHVRGTAMNAVDHPHGGGRGKSKGHNIPRSATGVPAKGYKTRKKKYSDSLIILRRQKKTRPPA